MARPRALRLDNSLPERTHSAVRKTPANAILRLFRAYLQKTPSPLPWTASLLFWGSRIASREINKPRLRYLPFTPQDQHHLGALVSKRPFQRLLVNQVNNLLARVAIQLSIDSFHMRLNSSSRDEQSVRYLFHAMAEKAGTEPLLHAPSHHTFQPAFGTPPYDHRRNLKRVLQGSRHRKPSTQSRFLHYGNLA